MKSDSRAGQILTSGIIYTVIMFLTMIIYYAFQVVISRQFAGAPGEYGLMNNTVTFITFLGTPVTIATQAVTHYIARFHFSGDDARLHGLLSGCRKFLLHITIGGSVLAVILVRPLSDFFNITRFGLTLIALVCVLGGLWTSYATAICQGLGWFKRLALIGFLAAIARLAFGWPTTHFWPRAEWAVLASVAMLLPTLILFFWRHEFPRRTKDSVSPWNADFVQFLIISSAWAFGAYFFTQGDQLVSQRYFSDSDRDAYSAAERLAVALVTGLGPLLTVMFTHRSGREHHHGDAFWDQIKLLALYAAGLLVGGACLYVMRRFCLQLLGRNTQEAVVWMGPLIGTMVFVGLLQALVTWSLASRWVKVSLLYGVLGLGYWGYILRVGKSPQALLTAMPVAAGTAFVVLFIFWMIAMRRHVPTPDEPPAAAPIVS